MPQNDSILSHLKRLVGDTDAVMVTRGVVKDVYDDIKGNQITDGPWSMDTGHCKNGHPLSAVDVRHILRDLKAGTRISESSNIITFDGVNPIAQACSKPRQR